MVFLAAGAGATPQQLPLGLTKPLRPAPGGGEQPMSMSVPLGPDAPGSGPTSPVATSAPSIPAGTCAAGVACSPRAAAAAGTTPAAGPRAAARSRARARAAEWRQLSGDPAAAAAAASADPYLPPWQLPDACKASAVADLDARVGALGFRPYSGSSSWGPSTITFPPVKPSDAPSGCDPAAWARWRLLGAAERLVAQGFCYCHHHALWWEPPESQRGKCSGDCMGARARPYQGADCSNYSGYLYNMAFGLRFTTAIGQQACQPGTAPGRVLPYTAADQDLFHPGDLLFITEGLSGVSAPQIRVSHVVVWTGLAADVATNGTALSLETLISNMTPRQRAGARAYAAKRAAAGLPVYVINDSTWTGPNYRPFAGWYFSSFSHARRVISADPSLPADAPGAVEWAGSNCLSRVCCSTTG